MGKRNRATMLPINLPQLQNLIKRDPISYKQDFLQQYRHFESQLDIFKLKPDEEAEEFGRLITFISQVAQCYSQETSSFPNQLINLLSECYQILNPNVRRTMVQALVLLRNKDIIPSITLLSLFFTLFRARDKQLRELLYSYIVTDIKNQNSKHKNNKLNKTLQSFMYTILQGRQQQQQEQNNVKIGGERIDSKMGEDSISAKKSLDVCIELYRKGIWNDAKTVNVIAEACFHQISKIKVTAIKFFLGSNQDQDDSSEDEKEIPNIKRLQHINQINKAKKSKKRKLDKALSTVRKKEIQKHRAENFNFSALHLLNDPQGFSEKLFSTLTSSQYNDRFEVKIITLNLISRIIGIHKLVLLNFYSYLQRYLQPHQRDVTLVLVILAQACHELVPPDVLEPVVRVIANNFVSDHCAGEVMAAGLNAIREICSRQPLAIDLTLLQDLTEYRSDKNKGVMIAARSLIGLFREINPELLKRKDRGKAASINLKDFKPLQYGQVRTMEQIDGIELLEEYKQKLVRSENEDEWSRWEIASDKDNSSDDEGWINVSSDDNQDINVSDSSDEEDSKINENENENNDKAKKISTLAMTQLLSPADFAKLNELKLEHKSEQLVNGVKRNRSSTQDEPSDIVDVNAITGPRKKAKQDYEERLESIRAGREGREKYGSSKGKKFEGASTTNKEKARNKAFMMVIHKKNALQKKKMSLRDKQIQLTRQSSNKKRSKK
ncbi:1718_t:CDS:10 [Funneliformis geosporum]|uniref:Protein SDA1 n=1 Tax=Funneliformis geosporum TaxID=1117311 RepID=A0A9W4SFV8_9GLOM|nr:13487_t:CDS:10 [Funneliformis geosporum]CAI2166332.1 1718_t:CDS:10 [Funneliformis geosporum]